MSSIIRMRNGVIGGLLRKLPAGTAPALGSYPQQSCPTMSRLYGEAVPSNYNSTLVGLAATVQFSALIPNFWIAECFINLQPACDAIAVAPLTVHEGFVDLPTAPGLGVELGGARRRAKPYRDMGTRMGKGLRSHTEEFPRKHYT